MVNEANRFALPSGPVDDREVLVTEREASQVKVSASRRYRREIPSRPANNPLILIDHPPADQSALAGLVIQLNPGRHLLGWPGYRSHQIGAHHFHRHRMDVEPQDIRDRLAKLHSVIEITVLHEDVGVMLANVSTEKTVVVERPRIHAIDGYEMLRSTVRTVDPTDVHDGPRAGAHEVTLG